MNYAIGYVVEGHGEVSAVPILARRIAASLEPPVYPHIPQPVRSNPYHLLDPGRNELSRAIELAALKAKQELDKAKIDDGLVVVHIILDREQDKPEDCPALLGPALLARAQAARSDLPMAVTLAKQEFECWFLAAAESIAGRRGFPANLTSPPDPESIRGAKEWLRDRRGRAYSEREDQPALSQLFDMQVARTRSDSFDKFFRDTCRLLSSVP